MELWIRTQDKTTLIRSYEIYIAEYSDSYVIRAKRTSHILGVYKKFERALEVLDEIHQRLINLQCIEITGADFISQQMKRNGIDCVYEMPKK